MSSNHDPRCPECPGPDDTTPATHSSDCACSECLIPNFGCSPGCLCDLCTESRRLRARDARARLNDLPVRIARFFDYQDNPTPQQLLAFDEIRKAAREFARIIYLYSPNGLDQKPAYRLIQHAMMVANAAVAHAPKEKRK